MLAFVTAPQFNVLSCPGKMVCGFAKKLLKNGVPLHTGGGGGGGGGAIVGGTRVTGIGVGAPGTVITTSNLTPNATPFDACTCHTPVYVPGVVGAVIAIEMLIMSPGLAAEIDCGEVAPSACPSTKTALYPPPQVHVPEF